MSQKNLNEDVMDYRDDWVRAIKRSRLSSNARHVARSIADAANWQDGKSSYLANETIADDTGLSVRTVQRARNELERGGWITTQKRPGNTGTIECELIYPADLGCQPVTSGASPCHARHDTQSSQGRHTVTPGMTHSHPTTSDTNTRTNTKTKRERAGAQSQPATPEQAREADASPLSEQIGPEQTNELVTAEIVETPQADVVPPVSVVTAEVVEAPSTVEQPPVTGQALSEEDLPKASDTPDAEEYIAALIQLIESKSTMKVRPNAWGLAQLADKAKALGWSVEELCADAENNIADWTMRNMRWRLDWLVKDMGTRAPVKPSARSTMAKHNVDNQTIGSIDRALGWIRQCREKGQHSKADHFERLLLKGVRRGTYTPTTDAHRAAIADMEARHG